MKWKFDWEMESKQIKSKSKNTKFITQQIFSPFRYVFTFFFFSKLGSLIQYSNKWMFKILIEYPKICGISYSKFNLEIILTKIL